MDHLPDVIHVQIPKLLESLIPGYIQNRHKDITVLQEALDIGDYEKIKVLAHQIKGSGAGYGFQMLTDIGSELEQHLSNENDAGIQQCIDLMSRYMSCIDITFA